LIEDLRNALKHLQNYAKVTYPCKSKTILSSNYSEAVLRISVHCVSAVAGPGCAARAASRSWQLLRPLLVIAGVLLILPYARGAESDSCYAPVEHVAAGRPISMIDPSNPEAIVFEVGALEAQLGDGPRASMTGGVLLRQGDKLAGANSARYDPTQRALLLNGNVRYEDRNSQVQSDSAEFAYGLGRIRFEGANFTIGANSAHGAAEALEINKEGRLELDRVSYTTCPPESNDWLIEATDIDLDTSKGVGSAKNVKLRFQGVPILWAPYLSFPISDARKSGVLAPQIGSTNRSGNQLLVPFYWNIAPNYDATITPRELTDRGFQLGAQFRYLTDTMNGSLDAEHLATDSMYDDKSRTMMQLKHRTMFVNGWRNRIDYREVSDSQYFEDLGGSLSVSSITHLNRTVSFDYHTDTISFFGQVQDYQTIDQYDVDTNPEGVVPEDEPYRRVPQLLVRGSWPDQWLGMRFGLDGELVNFDRDVGVTGWRLNMAPRVEAPFSRPGWFITPAVTLDHTQYELSDTLPGQDSSLNRTVPISSLDIGMVLERSMSGSREGRIQTIEPRMLYVHVPHSDQDDLPVFDTITPDLNLISLYRTNRFLGVDRIADTDQLSIGVTSRIFDASSGRELAAATIGQTRYLSASGVTMPGESLIDSDSSDYIAEVRFLLVENLNFDVGHQWGEKDRGTTQSQARLQYRPASNKILNLAYRFRRDSLEQGDLSWSWPVSTQWNFVGRYKFSFRDDEALDQFYGFEYESCCWGLRLVSRRYISARDGTRDSSIGLQLVLKGMSSVGTAADKMLERGILGYSANLR